MKIRLSECHPFRFGSDPGTYKVRGQRVWVKGQVRDRADLTREGSTRGRGRGRGRDRERGKGKGRDKGGGSNGSS